MDDVAALAVERPSMLRPYSVRAEAAGASDETGGPLVMF